jgi:glycosyltransferase involved in cell wall biosynthesis
VSPRVLHVVVAGEIGGAERMLIDLAGGDAAHAVALFTPNPSLRRLFLDRGLAVHDRGPVREHVGAYLWRSFGPSDVRWLGETIAGTRSDVVQTHTFASQRLGARAARQRGVKLVRTEHSTRVYDEWHCFQLSRASLLRADAVVAVSDHVREVARARLPAIAPRLHVIGNGIDTEHHRPAPSARAPGRPFTFVAVARLEPRKALGRALRALVATPAAALVLVGDGSERARLERLAAELGLRARVRFVGEQRDPRPFVQAADAALCSADKEALSLALLEAMAQGVPAVAVPVGGVPEVVRDGETGWLAADVSVPALAAAMRAAVATHAAELQARGARARAFVERHYGRQRMREKWQTLYSTLHSR